MTRSFLTFIALAAVIIAAPGHWANAQTKPLPGVAELHRLDTLPAFKRFVKVGSVSSYDRTGGNDDGFSGKHSFLRKEPGGLVIADLKGPGVITRMWTPTPTDDIVEFYFDGETTPRISVKFRDLFSGKQFPFLTPVSGIGAGGFYTYVPLPYKESCRVLVKAERLMFYQINYATYPASSPIETFTTKTTKDFDAHLERARKLFASYGSDISAHTTSSGEKLQTRKFDGTLAANQPVTIFEANRGGRIAGLRISP
ncbi:MAG TPA: hypothetical protein VM943_11990, partial [Pyrinomonadaceae bacterium]|nr:hypothetical protein [Pyrinomonadaceae bacterium]